MKTYRFTAAIEAGGGGGAFVTIPFDVPATFGTKGRVPVRASFDGVDYRGSLAPMSGAHILGIRKEIRRAIDKDVGDSVTVVLTEDADPHTVTVPAELANALRRVKGAKKAFDALSYTKRHEYAELITSAKRSETRALRIAKILATLET